MLATCGESEDGCVRTWRASAVSLVAEEEMRVSAHAVRSVRVSAGLVACCGDEGLVWLTDCRAIQCRLEQGEPRRSRGLVSCDVDRNGRLVCGGGSTSMVSIWDVKRRRLAREVRRDATVRSVRFDSTGACVASADESRSIVLHAVRTKRQVARVSNDTVATSLEFSPTRAHVLAAHGGSTVSIWDASRASLMTRLSMEDHEHGRPTGVAFSPLNHKFMAATTPNGLVEFFDFDACRSLTKLDCGFGATQILFLTERTVVVGLDDGFLQTYDLRVTSQPTSRVDAHAGCPIASMHFGSIDYTKPRHDEDDDVDTSSAVTSIRDPNEDIVPRRDATQPRDLTNTPVNPTPVNPTPARPPPENLSSAVGTAAPDLTPAVLSSDRRSAAPSAVNHDALTATVNAAATDVCLEVENLHLDMLRQFQIQYDQVARLINDNAAQISRLVDENDRLRAENHQLRSTVLDLGGALPQSSDRKSVAST